MWQYGTNLGSCTLVVDLSLSSLPVPEWNINNRLWIKIIDCIQIKHPHPCQKCRSEKFLHLISRPGKYTVANSTGFAFCLFPLSKHLVFTVGDLRTSWTLVRQKWICHYIARGVICFNLGTQFPPHCVYSKDNLRIYSTILALIRLKTYTGFSVAPTRVIHSTCVIFGIWYLYLLSEFRCTLNRRLMKFLYSLHYQISQFHPDQLSLHVESLELQIVAPGWTHCWNSDNA